MHSYTLVLLPEPLWFDLSMLASYHRWCQLSIGNQSQSQYSSESSKVPPNTISLPKSVILRACRTAPEQLLHPEFICSLAWLTQDAIQLLSIAGLGILMTIYWSGAEISGPPPRLRQRDKRSEGSYPPAYQEVCMHADLAFKLFVFFLQWQNSFEGKMLLLRDQPIMSRLITEYHRWCQL